MIYLLLDLIKCLFFGWMIMLKFKMKSNLTAIFLTSIFFCSTEGFAATEGDVNQVDFALISDPHVDINNEEAVNINPDDSHKGEDLDKRSFITLVSKFSNELSQLPENPSFIVTLGDLPSHNDVSQRARFLDSAFQTFYEKFNPMPMFYSFGNNDSIEKDYGAFKYKGESAYEINKKVTSTDGFLSSGSKCPFTNKPCIINENENYGYYSAYIGDHLKLISLNSVIFVSRPGFSPSREGDKEQLEWLNNELKQSQNNKEQVILTMHVAPNSWMPEYESPFKDLINTYPGVVIGLFAAHTHFDELYVLKSSEQTIPVIFSAGLSTAHGNSSSFKTVSIRRENNSSWAIQNYTTYYFKGDKADVSSIEKYYDFNTAFCSSGSDSFTHCLNSQIAKKGSRYVFSAEASKLLSEHYNANPNVPGKVNATDWVMNY